MSPRAACRLEALGFEEVYDYILGIADWKAAGLPMEGTAAPVLRVMDAARDDVPTCTPDESIGEVRRRTFAAAWDECMVVDCGDTVVGRLRNGAWDEDDVAIVVDVMEPGPTTVRPNGLLQPLVDRMGERGTKLVVVTTAQGTLLGALRRVDGEVRLSGPPPIQGWQECEGCPGQWKVE